MDADLFYALLRFEEAALALRATLRLQVVDRLAERSLSLREFIDEFGFTEQAGRTFALLLVAMRVLEGHGEMFTVTEIARRCLSADRPASRAPYLAMGMGEDVDQLIDLLRGVSHDATPLYGEEGGHETLMDIAPVGSAIAHGLASRARNFARPLAEAIAGQISPGATVLADIGAGSPYVAAASFQRMPQLKQVILVDRPNGMRFVREMADKQGIDTSRLVFCEQDFFRSVPAADVYCISNTAHDWLRADYSRLIDNVRRVIADDGLVCIHEPLLLDAWQSDREWIEALWMACYALTLLKLTVGQGSCYTAAEHDAVLAASGFRRATGPQRTSDGCSALFYRR